MKYKYNQKVSRPVQALSTILTALVYAILIALAVALLSLIIDFITWIWV